MATKQEAIDFLNSKYTAEDLGDCLYKLNFNLDPGRSQVILVEVNDNWMIMGSAFATTEDLTPKQALEAASEWICGILLIEDTYIVRNVLPIAELDESELHDGMKIVLNIADTLEQKYSSKNNF